jgi:hypothetical protein
LVNFDLALLLGSKPDIHTAPTFERLNIFPKVIELFSRAATNFSFALIFRVLPKILCSLHLADGTSPALVSTGVRSGGSKPDIHTAPTFERQNIFRKVIELFSRAATNFSFALIFKVLFKILCILQLSDNPL